MENIIAVFNNRNHTMQFASILRKMGINNKVINTPRELSVSCGVSVLFSKNYIDKAKMIVNQFRFSSFVNFYLVKSSGVFKKYQPL